MIINIMNEILINDVSSLLQFKCGEKDEPERQLMCDECDLPYHMKCLTPPMEKVPEEDEWYCPKCKNDGSKVIKAGQKLKESKKTSKSNRDWGKGMACVGRSKVCTIVPPNHFGPIPGVPVGSCWKFRVQVSSLCKTICDIIHQNFNE